MRTQYDFRGSRPATDVPALVRHQARNRNKTRIAIYIDTVVLDALRERADSAGQAYHPTVNAVLKHHLEHEREEDFETLLRRVVRDELKQICAQTLGGTGQGSVPDGGVQEPLPRPLAVGSGPPRSTVPGKPPRTVFEGPAGSGSALSASAIVSKLPVALQPASRSASPVTAQSKATLARGPAESLSRPASVRTGAA